jgi:hypothetical protein
MNLLEMTAEERLIFLESDAYYIEAGQYFKPFAEDEKHLEQESFTQIAEKIEQLEMELKRKQLLVKEAITPLKELYRAHLNNLRNNGKLTMGNLYYMADQENGVMNIFTPEGRLFNSRPLKVEERTPKLAFKKVMGEGFADMTVKITTLENIPDTSDFSVTDTNVLAELENNELTAHSNTDESNVTVENVPGNDSIQNITTKRTSNGRRPVSETPEEV